jgi:hypothetical protein
VGGHGFRYRHRSLGRAEPPHTGGPWRNHEDHGPAGARPPQAEGPRERVQDGCGDAASPGGKAAGETAALRGHKCRGRFAPDSCGLPCHHGKGGGGSNGSRAGTLPHLNRRGGTCWEKATGVDGLCKAAERAACRKRLDGKWLRHRLAWGAAGGIQRALAWMCRCGPSPRGPHTQEQQPWPGHRASTHIHFPGGAAHARRSWRRKGWDCRRPPRGS